MITNLDQIARHLCSLIPVSNRQYESVGSLSIFLDACTCMSAFPYIHETKCIIVLFIATPGVSVTHQRYNTISLYSVYIEENNAKLKLYIYWFMHIQTKLLIIDRFFAESTSSISSINVLTNKPVICSIDFVLLESIIDCIVSSCYDVV